MRLPESTGFRRTQAHRTPLLTLATVAIALAFMHPVPVSAHEGHATRTARVATPSQDASRYEIKFMKDMIDHHQMALMMSETCQERATHDELKEMCRTMEADQAAEIRQMRTWLHDWHKGHVDSMMTPARMKSMNAMGSMKSLSRLSGREYEIAFMKEMSRHHRMAIKRAAECATKARHEELIAMCRAIETNQKREIEQFNEWLCKWYQQCR